MEIAFNNWGFNIFEMEGIFVMKYLCQSCFLVMPKTREGLFCYSCYGRLKLDEVISYFNKILSDSKLPVARITNKVSKKHIEKLKDIQKSLFKKDFEEIVKWRLSFLRINKVK